MKRYLPFLICLLSALACEHWYTSIAIPEQDLPQAVVSEYYSYEFVVETDSSEDFYVEVTDGELPPGLNVLERGELSGTPLATGTYEFEITAVQDIQYTWQDDCTDLASNCYVDHEDFNGTNSAIRTFEITVTELPE